MLVEIVGKFGASMSGFWWSLDDEERKLLLGGVAWAILMVVQVGLERERKRRERDELVALVAEEVAARGA